VLETGAAGQASRDVSPDKEGYKQRQENPDEACYASPVAAELPPRAEKIAPTIALKIKPTPGAANQPTMTLVQLVPKSALRDTLTPFPDKD
jgi:hypothetical protein